MLPFTFALLVLLFILLTNFMLRVLDRFLGKGLGFGILMEYMVLNLAWIVALAVPMAVLVATLMAFGRLSQDNEITALRTAGLSYATILQPALLFGTLVCLGLILFNNEVLPEANHKARLLSADINRKRPDLAIEAGYFVDNLPNYAMMVKGREGELFTDILIYSKGNQEHQLTIFAERGRMQAIDDAILLYLEDGEIHEVIVPEHTNYRRLVFNRHRIVVPMDNLYLERRDSKHRGDREMDVQMMLDRIRNYRQKAHTVKDRIAKRIATQTRLALEGDTTRTHTMAVVKAWHAVLEDSSWASRADSIRTFRRARNLERGMVGDFNLLDSYYRAVNRYMVEIHKKFALPFACVVFILVGAPVGILARRGGFVVATSMSMGFFILYWAMLIGGEELADRGLISPAISMWSANVLLAFLGVLLISNLQKEQRTWTWDFLDFFKRRKQMDLV